MNKVLLIITLLFTLSNFALAQSSSDARWAALVTPPSEEFSVQMPAAPKFNSYNKSQRYTVLFENTYFFVFSDSLDNLIETEKVFEFIKDSKAVGSNIKVGNIAAEKFGFADAEGFHHKILAVKTKARSYIFQTISEVENDPNVERFFASIKFNRILSGEPAPAKNEIETNTNLPTDKENKLSSAGNGIGITGGYGRGEGNGSGSSTNQTTSPVPANQTSGLKILSKPKPNYTDWARFYQIEGSVKLRVTFLASGSIGSVSPVSKLPLGLTTMAINAARGIRFEPAMKEGIPISVTKLVEYHFLIY